MIKPYSRILFAFCFLFCAKTNAQIFFRLDSIKDVIVLDRGWKFHDGDNKEWANPAFDDRNWDSISLDDEKDLSGKYYLNGIRWLRLHLIIAPKLFYKTLLLQVKQSGASEIYLNNNLIESFGNVGNHGSEIPYNPGSNIYHIQLGGDTIQLLAVRYSQNSIQKTNDPDYTPSPTLIIKLANISKVNDFVLHDQIINELSLFVFAVFLTLSIFHFLLFIYYRKARSNLYYSIFALLIACEMLTPYLEYTSHNPLLISWVGNMQYYLIAPCFFLIVLLLYNIFNRKFNWFFWTLICLTVLLEVTFYMNKIAISIFLVFTQTCSASCSGIVMIIKALRKKQPGAWIIASGFLVFLCLIPGMVLIFTIGNIVGHGKFGINDGGVTKALLIVWIFSIPASMSAYLASDFARTNKKLSLQLVHVKQLSEQNIEKEREKKQIIEGQKQMLEVQVKEKTSEIEKQKNELVQKNTEIIDSILYARRIQTAILPSDEMLKEALGDYLVVFKPKDVVSGDFYWCHVSGDFVVFAVADCTGHGVPGALMSMICNSLLNEVVIDGKTLEADVILNELRSKLILTLQQSGGHTTQDGMDIALCVWNKKDNMLQFAGANNPLYRIGENILEYDTIIQSGKIKQHNDHLMEIVGDKQPIGYQEGKMNTMFTKHRIQLRKGDTIYISSDGYIDQFGGIRNKKFTSKRLRDILSTFHGHSIESQRMSLVQTMEDWKKNEVQTDDICVFAIKI